MVTMPSRTPILEKAKGTGSTELQQQSTDLAVTHASPQAFNATKFLASSGMTDLF